MVAQFKFPGLCLLCFHPWQDPSIFADLPAPTEAAQHPGCANGLSRGFVSGGPLLRGFHSLMIEILHDFIYLSMPRTLGILVVKYTLGHAGFKSSTVSPPWAPWYMWGPLSKQTESTGFHTLMSSRLRATGRRMHFYVYLERLSLGLGSFEGNYRAPSRES